MKFSSLFSRFSFCLFCFIITGFFCFLVVVCFFVGCLSIFIFAIFIYFFDFFLFLFLFFVGFLFLSLFGFFLFFFLLFIFCFIVFSAFGVCCFSFRANWVFSSFVF